MILKTPSRRYNLSTWVYFAPGGNGIVTIHMPGISYPMWFEDTSSKNPVDPDVVLHIIESCKGQGTYTVEEFADLYAIRLEVVEARGQRGALRP